MHKTDLGLYILHTLSWNPWLCKPRVLGVEELLESINFHQLTLNAAASHSGDTATLMSLHCIIRQTQSAVELMRRTPGIDLA